MMLTQMFNTTQILSLVFCYFSVYKFRWKFILLNMIQFLACFNFRNYFHHNYYYYYTTTTAITTVTTITITTIITTTIATSYQSNIRLYHFVFPLNKIPKKRINYRQCKISTFELFKF